MILEQLSCIDRVRYSGKEVGNYLNSLLRSTTLGIAQEIPPKEGVDHVSEQTVESSMWINISEYLDNNTLFAIFNKELKAQDRIRA